MSDETWLAREIAKEKRRTRQGIVLLVIIGVLVIGGLVAGGVYAADVLLSPAMQGNLDRKSVV